MIRALLHHVLAPLPDRAWVDAQLPPAVARWLAEDHGITAAHVTDVGRLGATDEAIFVAARAGGADVVITKDDLVRLLEQPGPPPQVVWVTCGNVRNAELRRVVLPAWPRAAALLAAGELLVEIGSARRVLPPTAAATTTQP